MLDHEKLDVYQCALRFAALAFQILQKIPRGHSELTDQLRRATISIPLNIAEGAGKPTDKDRSRFHAIARASAMECGAILDIMHLQALAEPQTLTEAKSLLVRSWQCSAKCAAEPATRTRTRTATRTSTSHEDEYGSLRQADS
jgi:four helix bundle protein